MPPHRHAWQARNWAAGLLVPIRIVVPVNPGRRPAEVTGQPDEPPPVPQQWTIEAWEDDRGRSPFASWLTSLSPYDQAVVRAALRFIVAPLGIDICSTGWGKPLGKGLYEIRVHSSLYALMTWGQPDPESAEDYRDNQVVLLRLFCTFHGHRIVFLFQGYDKGADPSERRQAREIAQARKYLAAWQSESRRSRRR